MASSSFGTDHGACALCVTGCEYGNGHWPPDMAQGLVFWWVLVVERAATILTGTVTLDARQNLRPSRS